MNIERQKWKLPSEEDGNAFMVRTAKAEMNLRQTLDLLYHVLQSIPHKPASKIKTQIQDHLTKFQCS